MMIHESVADAQAIKVESNTIGRTNACAVGFREAAAKLALDG